MDEAYLIDGRELEIRVDGRPGQVWLRVARGPRMYRWRTFTVADFRKVVARYEAHYGDEAERLALEICRRQLAAEPLAAA